LTFPRVLTINAVRKSDTFSSGKFRNFSGLTITNGNVTNGPGGGIFIDGGNSGTLTLSDCTVSGNSTTGSGGGIYGVAANLGKGGGIYGVAANLGKGGGSIVTVSNSTINGNSAVDGGGIYNAGGDFLAFADVSVNNSAVSGNSATGNGGGIYNRGQQGGIAELGSTILNAGDSGENIFNDGGTVTSHGYNLSSDNGGGYLIGQGDQINTDPMLGLCRTTADQH
jgi:predicted outer membrane repeat protein